MKVLEGKVTSKFGKRVHPVTGKESFHNGVDVGCAIGTEVMCPADGVVKAAYEHETGGKTLIVGAGDRRYGFCHLSKVFWSVGTKVYKGEIIALTGATGRITGAHCHYTVKDGGRWNGNEYVGGEWLDAVKFLNV